MSTNSGPTQRAATGQVQVVLDDHDRTRLEVRTNASGGRGEDDGAAAGGHARSERMDDLARGEALVEVAPAAQDEDPMPVVGKRPGVGSVAAGGVGRKNGSVSSGTPSAPAPRTSAVPDRPLPSNTRTS